MVLVIFVSVLFLTEGDDRIIAQRPTAVTAALKTLIPFTSHEKIIR